jgi:hypothetical protein
MPTTDTTTLATIQPSENRGLSSTLLGLETQLENAARQNLEEVLRTRGTTLQAFTDLEMMALVETEKLRLVNGMDLATVMIRGKIIGNIEARALHTVHPNGFADLTALASSVGISVSELSDIRTMTQIIFPWIEENLGSVATVWDALGKTKFRSLVPYLKACITGELPDTESARTNFNRILDTTAVEMREFGEEDVTEERVRNQAARNLIHMAGEETTRGVQEHLRDGNVTPALNPVVVVVDGRRYLLSEVNEDQLLVAQRKLGRHMSQPSIVELPADARARQREATRIPLLRQINRIFEG